jgi:3-hydroxyisobutyrate dehydrogenase
MLKDLLLSQDAAQAGGARTELGRHAAEIFARFVADGHAAEDFSAVINAVRHA